MLRICGLGLMCISAFLSTSVYSMGNNALRSGASMEFKFAPNKAEPITNFSFRSIKANCVITTEDESDELFFVALAKKGEINDTELLVGGSMVVRVHPGENMRLKGDPGAKIEITNLGNNTVTAICSLA